MHILKNIHSLKLISSIKPEEGHLLYDFITEQKIENIIEAGTGKSTLYFLAAIKENGKGHLTSIDINEIIDDRHDHGTKCLLLINYAMDFFGEKFLDAHIDFVIEDSIKVLKNYDDYKCDVFMHDSKHTYKHLYNELLALENLKYPPMWFICHDCIHDFAKAVFGKTWFKNRWKSFRRARHLEIFKRCGL